jgi:hypothetical protein
LVAREGSGYEALVKGMLVVVPLLADGMKPADEIVAARQAPKPWGLRSAR